MTITHKTKQKVILNIKFQQKSSGGSLTINIATFMVSSSSFCLGLISTGDLYGWLLFFIYFNNSGIRAKLAHASTKSTDYLLPPTSICIGYLYGWSLYLFGFLYKISITSHQMLNHAFYNYNVSLSKWRLYDFTFFF